MNIIVLVKQVPDTSEVKINRETNTLIRDGVPSIINPFDMYAIEEALRLREQHGGKVTAVTMGPPQAAEALKEAVAMGVDDVVLLSDRRFCRRRYLGHLLYPFAGHQEDRRVTTSLLRASRPSTATRRRSARRPRTCSAFPSSPI